MTVVAMLEEAIDALRDESTFDLSDEELGEHLQVLAREKARLAAYEAEVTAAFDRRCAFRGDGSRNAAVWLVRNCGVSKKAAAGQVRLARRLQAMPATKAALQAGDITAEQAVVLARLACSNRRPVRDAFLHAEETLVEQAKTLLYRDFETVVACWQDLVDPDGTETQADDDYDARELHASELLRGVVRIDGTLDPIGGAIFLTELVRLERRMFDEDWAKAKAEHGDDTSPDHLWRSPAQRRADALSEMATRSANADQDLDPDSQKRPLFTVHIGPDIPARMCELASGKVIAPGLLVPHLGQADIERIVYGPEKRVLELSKTDRFFRGAQRRAMELRDRFCTTPGCDIPAEHCQADHIKPASQRGETSLGNGRMKCGHDNRWAYQNEQQPPGPDPPATG